MFNDSVGEIGKRNNEIIKIRSYCHGYHHVAGAVFSAPVGGGPGLGGLEGRGPALGGGGRGVPLRDGI